MENPFTRGLRIDIPLTFGAFLLSRVLSAAGIFMYLVSDLRMQHAKVIFFYVENQVNTGMMNKQ